MTDLPPGSGDIEVERRTELAGKRTELADRRTELAIDRTRLAWWRTGLTSIAVAVGVGRLLPELVSSSLTWPYSVLGVGFAVYGIAFFIYGTTQARAMREQIAVSGVPAGTGLKLLAGAGALLGLATIVLIVWQ